MPNTPKPVMACVHERGALLGRCVYTPQRGWKFLPTSCAHQASRKFWGAIEDCIPNWASRDPYELMTVEAFNKKFPKLALKTGASLPLTSPSTILGMMSPTLLVSPGNPIRVEPKVDLRKALQDLVIELTSLKLRWPGSTSAEAPLWEKLEAAKAALTNPDR